MPPRIGDAEECRSCHAPVYWALSPAGKRSPIDEPLDAEKGNVMLLRPEGLGGEVLAVVLSGDALKIARERGMRLHLNHWATCPDKAEWRAKQEAKRAAAKSG